MRKKWRIGPLLDRGDDLVGHAQDGVAAEADGDRLLLGVVGRETRRGQRGIDDRREIAVGPDVPHARPGDQSAGENPAAVAFPRLLDAVGGHQHRAGELVELPGLVLPGAAVVAHQVLVLFQARIGVAGEHLAVGIDVDAPAFGLLEQLFEVLQVVAGNRDRLAPDGRDADLRRLGMAIRAGVGLVQQGHDLQIQFAGLHHPAQGCRRSWNSSRVRKSRASWKVA